MDGEGTLLSSAKLWTLLVQIPTMLSRRKTLPFSPLSSLFNSNLFLTVSFFHAVVKEAATLKKHNLFVDSIELQCLSQSSLTESRTPPLSAPSSPAVVQYAAQKAEQCSSSSVKRNGSSEKQPEENKHESADEAVDAHPSKPSEHSAVLSMPFCVSADSPDQSKVLSGPKSDSSEPVCEISVDKPDMVSCTSLPEAGDAMAQSQAVISTAVDLNTSPVIIVSEPESLEDQSNIVNLPTELNTESHVSPASGKENQSVGVSEETKVDARIEFHSEICDAASAPYKEPRSGTVQPVTSDAENPSGFQIKDTDSPQTVTLCYDSSSPKVDTTVGEIVAESVMENSSTANTNGFPNMPNVSAGGDTTAQFTKVKPEGITDPCQDSFTDEPLDSVKSIRDLVVEIIEVEDIVSPCPDSTGIE